MNTVKRSCANCSSFDPAHGCWALANVAPQADTPQVWPQSTGPDTCCKDHRTQLESDAQDAALYAFWQPLLIKSRRATIRTRGDKGRPSNADRLA